MKKINPADLIPLDIFIGIEPIEIDLVYAHVDHPRNIFETAIYSHQKNLWAHKDIAAITLLAARKLNKDRGFTLEIQDCLRTVDAQEAMQETPIVKANPHWMLEPRLLAPPGAGGHPRAMAIDVRVIDKNAEEVNMGTPFDHMDKTSARDYIGFSDEILQNRKMLEDAFIKGANLLGHDFLPLPSEWWDFRFPPEHTNIIEPLRDAQLPPQMQMTNKIENDIPDFDKTHFKKLSQEIIDLIDSHNANL